MKKEKIKVIVDRFNSEEQEKKAKTARFSFEDLKKLPTQKVIELDFATLSEDINSTFSQVVTLIEGLPKEGRTSNLESVQFNLAINSEGQISLFSSISGAISTNVGFTFTITVE